MEEWGGLRRRISFVGFLGEFSVGSVESYWILLRVQGGLD